MSKVGRNDPCPCGSGKKYKKCCLPKDQEEHAQMLADQLLEPLLEEPFLEELHSEVDEAVDRILQRLEAGNGSTAEFDLKKLLSEYPLHPMPYFGMGVYLATFLKDPAAALPHFRRAVVLSPLFAEAYFNLATAAQKSGEIATAVTAYQATVELCEPDDELAKMASEQLAFIEGVLKKTTPFSNLDEYVENENLFQEAYLCLVEQDFRESARLFRLVLKDNPEHVQSYGNLALAYAGLGLKGKSLESLNRALQLDPEYGPAITNLPVISKMREGEPYVPKIQETNFYVDRVKQGR
jgi:protein O-GlcNAc transferase